MPFKSVSTLLPVALLLAVIPVSMLYVNSYSVPRFDYAPIQRSSPPLVEKNAEAILTKQFKIIRRTRQVPTAVVQSFTNLTGFRFNLADPGKPMSSDDMTSGDPQRRLIFVGLADKSAIFVYEQGGFVGSVIVLVFSFDDNGSAWAASLDYNVRNIDGLRTVIRRRQFHDIELPFR